jgi:hypothetical protein
MAGEIAPTQAGIDPTTFSLADAVKNLLPRGHVIHGYSSASSERVIKILKERKYSDDAELLGFGVDGRAERALGRALLTYAMRERDGLASISATQYPEIDHAQVPGGTHLSRFDNIVWRGDFKLYQDGEVVVASSSYGGGFGMSPLEVSAPDALSAMVALAEDYQFMNDRMKGLPAVSFE